jgi:hypothetical protein
MDGLANDRADTESPRVSCPANEVCHRPVITYWLGYIERYLCMAKEVVQIGLTFESLISLPSHSPGLCGTEQRVPHQQSFLWNELHFKVHLVLRWIHLPSILDGVATLAD